MSAEPMDLESPEQLSSSDEPDSQAPAPAPEDYHDPTLRARIRERVAELIRLRNTGHRLTSGQQSLIDFWLVDCTRSNPPDPLSSTLLQAAESEESRWRR
jgi:hypothetical protein